MYMDETRDSKGIGHCAKLRMWPSCNASTLRAYALAVDRHTTD
ncbi:hypothetical protein ACVILJ_002621 [Bradyrhizobium diazoefficiens]